MSKRFLRINLLLAFLGIGWALFSRASQASAPGGALYPCKLALRSMASPELLTNIEHLASAIGTPSMCVAMLWSIYCLTDASGQLSLAGKGGGARLFLVKLLLPHYGAWAVALSFGVYLVHQIEKEFFNPANLANQFAWDLGGMAIGLLVVVLFLRRNYQGLHRHKF